MADAGENAGIGNLVAVQGGDRQNHPAGCRGEKLVGMPTRGQGAGFRFAVADDTGNYQIRVVEGRSVGVRESVAELAAFVNRTGRLRCNVARDTAGERELGEEAFHAFFIGRNVRIDLAVRPLKVSVCDQTGAAVPGAGDVDHLEVVLLDQPVQVNVDEVQ